MWFFHLVGGRLYYTGEDRRGVSEPASVAGGGVIEQDGGTGDDKAGGDFWAVDSERVY